MQFLGAKDESDVDEVKDDNNVEENGEKTKDRRRRRHIIVDVYFSSLSFRAHKKKENKIGLSTRMDAMPVQFNVNAFVQAPHK